MKYASFAQVPSCSCKFVYLFRNIDDVYAYYCMAATKKRNSFSDSRYKLHPQKNSFNLSWFIIRTSNYGNCLIKAWQSIFSLMPP